MLLIGPEILFAGCEMFELQTDGAQEVSSLCQDCLRTSSKFVYVVLVLKERVKDLY